MIDEEATFKAFGYYSYELSKGSGKSILAACDDCGKVRETSKSGYHALCRKCCRKNIVNLQNPSPYSLSGDNHPAWKGGISFKPYCMKFNKAYKNHIRNLFGNECFLCDMTPEMNGAALSVHHVNYNKSCGCDKTKCICVPLCMGCHSKTGTNRDFWQALIMEMLKPVIVWS